jgi:DNA adenine methylase
MDQVVMPLRPPLKWAGGKRWLIPELKQLWSDNSELRLVEPFCGGLSVALGLQAEKALLNDVNFSVINFYQQIQLGLKLDISLENDEEAYYKHRTEFNRLNQLGGEDIKTAQLFYYLNRTGYNGLCRFNKSGGYNVPFGRYKKINYQTDFSQYQSVLAAWEFSNEDFAELDVNENDFIYADPPYDVPFRQYAQRGFSWEDQVRLAEWLAQHKGPVVLSNQETDRIVDLYKKLGFKLRYMDAPRRISCKVSGRKPAKEVIATRGI